MKETKIYRDKYKRQNINWKLEYRIEKLLMIRIDGSSVCITVMGLNGLWKTKEKVQIKLLDLL